MQTTKEQHKIEITEANQLQKKVSILTSLLSIGSIDFNQAVETLDSIEQETGKNYFDDFLEYLDSLLKYGGIKLSGIDLNYYIYLYILGRVKNELYTYYVENKLVNLDFGYIYVVAEYYCTSFDRTEQMKSTIERIPENKRPALVSWLYNQIS